MPPLHVTTPLWPAPALSQALGAPVLLKMEALQPVGSFKIRGIGHLCQQAWLDGARGFVASSGGNAGYAAAYAGRALGVPVTIVVPRTTPAAMRSRLTAIGGAVVEHGDAWDDAHAHAVALARERGDCYVHPFDDPRLWEGHATLVDELVQDGVKPGAVVLAVGGGGLLCGVLAGLHRAGWADVPVLAVETEGAASFAAAVAAGALVTLPRIASIAGSLGARTVAARALAWTREHAVFPWTVSDRDAVDACVRFADEHRVLVEPACGAALAAVQARPPALAGRAPVVVIACGGAGVTLELLARWRRQCSG